MLSSIKIRLCIPKISENMPPDERTHVNANTDCLQRIIESIIINKTTQLMLLTYFSSPNKSLRADDNCFANGVLDLEISALGQVFAQLCQHILRRLHTH